jgi:hypothetical protein
MAQDKLKVEISDREAKRLDLKTKMLDAEVVAEGYAKLPVLIDLADKNGDRENLKSLMRAVIDVIEWRQSPEDPKKGDALVRLYELPPGLWTPQGAETTRPDKPLISSSGRVKWLPDQDSNLGHGD